VNKPKNALRFTYIKLRNWRNFRSVDIALQRRAFLVGPNASGKSNFLDAFRFLRDIVSVGGGFQEAVEKRGGLSKIRCLAARKDPDVSIEVTIGSDSNKHRWRYEITFGQDRQRKLVLKKERVIKNKKDVILERPDPDDKKDIERLTQTHLEQINVNKLFREIAEFFRTIHYLHVVPQIIREPDRSTGRIKDPYGGDFLEQMAKTKERERKSKLTRILKALKATVPQLQELELTRDERGFPHLRGRYEHWRGHGAWQTEEHFSDGTLRLIGLLWALLDGNGPLLLEEPELSLHPEVIIHIPQTLARLQGRTGRQIMISTHSLDLLRDEGIGMDEVFLLLPGREGTDVQPAEKFEQVRRLLRYGDSLADAVLPITASAYAQAAQLPLFGD